MGRFDNEVSDECHYTGYQDGREYYGENMNSYLETNSKKKDIIFYTHQRQRVKEI